MSSSNKQAILLVAVIFSLAVGTILYVNFTDGSVSTGNHQDQNQELKSKQDSVNYNEERKSIIDCENMDPTELQMPKFLGSIPNITMNKGENVSITCVVENLGQYRMAWLKLHSQTILTIHNHIITRNKRFDLSIDTQTLETPCKNRIVETTITMYTLHINEIGENDDGVYLCQINTDPMKGSWGSLKIES